MLKLSSIKYFICKYSLIGHSGLPTILSYLDEIEKYNIL